MKILNFGVVFISLAPYRTSLYENLYHHLEAHNGSLTVFSGRFHTSLHPWDDTLTTPIKVPIVWITKNSQENSTLQSKVSILVNLWRGLNKNPPDVVWTHEFSVNSLTALAWALKNGRSLLISTEIGNDYRAAGDYKRLSIFHKAYQSIFLRFAKGIIACTKDAERRATALGIKHIFSPHAIDTTKYLPPEIKTSGATVRFLQVGSLIKRKGCNLLIKAFAEAASKNRNIRLSFIGSGAPNELEALAESLGIRDLISFKPFTTPENLILEYQSSDIFVLASLAETYGVVVHEAASCGLPLLLSKRVGATETLLCEGVTGFSFDPEDIAETSLKILLLAADRHLRTKCGHNARAIAEKYCVKQQAAMLGKWMTSLAA